MLLKKAAPLLLMRIIATLAFASPALPVAAQTGTGPSDADVPSRVRLWTAKLPGGEISIALSSIQMVGSHEYIVDGGARVVEVNVGVSGPLVTRFYFIGAPDVKSPLGVGQTALNQMIEKAQTLGERTGADQAWKRVVKNYPATTHAHTIEYRLDTEAELQKLFESVSKAWKQGRPDDFKLE